jgi:hypothetical protein
MAKGEICFRRKIFTDLTKTKHIKIKKINWYKHDIITRGIKERFVHMACSRRMDCSSGEKYIKGPNKLGLK